MYGTSWRGISRECIDQKIQLTDIVLLHKNSCNQFMEIQGKEALLSESSYVFHSNFDVCRLPLAMDNFVGILPRVRVIRFYGTKDVEVVEALESLYSNRKKEYLMIEKSDILCLHYFDYKMPFTGSYGNMRYRFFKVEHELESGEKEARMLVTVWPGPYAFDHTSKEVQKSHEFEFSENGKDAAVDWLNEIADEYT